MATELSYDPTLLAETLAEVTFVADNVRASYELARLNGAAQVGSLSQGPSRFKVYPILERKDKGFDQHFVLNVVVMDNEYPYKDPRFSPRFTVALKTPGMSLTSERHENRHDNTTSESIRLSDVAQLIDARLELVT